MHLSIRNRPAALGLLALALIPLARLPQLLSPHLAADADECIVGLMTRHLIVQAEVAPFFWGQRYGFSLVEILFAAPLFAVFGSGTVALKIAMLALWSVGSVFLARAAAIFSGRRVTWAALALLALCPAWGVWSMKARGGYLTAWTLGNIALWLIARADRTERPRAALSIALGALAPLVFFSQPIWIVGLIPFYALGFERRRRWDELGSMALGAAPVLALLILASRVSGSVAWAPPLFFDSPEGPLALLRVPERLWVHFTGLYYLAEPLAPTAPMALAAALWSAALLASLYGPVKGLLLRRAYSPEQACVLAVLATLALSLLINRYYFHPRYFLPVTGYLVLALTLEGSSLTERRPSARRPVFAALALLVIAGVLFAMGLGRYSFSGRAIEGRASEREAARALIAELDRLGVRHVYTTDAFLTWRLAFESDERILARWTQPPDRYPPYGRAVDGARRAGLPTALAGEARSLQRYLETLARGAGGTQIRPRVIAGRYFVLPPPARD